MWCGCLCVCVRACACVYVCVLVFLSDLGHAFGHLQKPSRCFIEERVFGNKEIWCGAGIKPAMLKCTPEQLLRATGGERVQLALD